MALSFSGLPAPIREVGLSLAAWCHTDGWTHRTLEKVAGLCGASRATAARGLKELEDAGWLYRSGGGRAAVTYQLTIPLPAEAMLEAALAEEKASHRRDPSSTTTVSGMTRKGLSPGVEPSHALGNARAEGFKAQRPGGGDGYRSGAPSPWTWAGIRWRDWIQMPKPDQDAVMERYIASSPTLGETLKSQTLAPDPKEATA